MPEPRYTGGSCTAGTAKQLPDAQVPCDAYSCVHTQRPLQRLTCDGSHQRFGPRRAAHRPASAEWPPHRPAAQHASQIDCVLYESRELSIRNVLWHVHGVRRSRRQRVCGKTCYSCHICMSHCAAPPGWPSTTCPRSPSTSSLRHSPQAPCRKVTQHLGVTCIVPASGTIFQHNTTPPRNRLNQKGSGAALLASPCVWRAALCVPTTSLVVSIRHLKERVEEFSLPDTDWELGRSLTKPISRPIVRNRPYIHAFWCD